MRKRGAKPRKLKKKCLIFNPDINWKNQCKRLLLRTMFPTSFIVVASCSYVNRDQHSLVYLSPSLRVSYFFQPSRSKHEEEWKSTWVKPPWAVKRGPLESRLNLSPHRAGCRRAGIDEAEAGFVYWKRNAFQISLHPLSSFRLFRDERVRGPGVLGSLLGAHEPWGEKWESTGIPLHS